MNRNGYGWRLVAPWLACGLILGGQAGATVRIWPGAAPCDGTLNACITAAASNDVIEIRTDGPIDEAIFVNKPLGVVAGAGYRPVVAAGRGVTAFYGPGNGIAWNMLFDGLVFAEGGIGVRSYSGDATITLRNLDVYATTNAYVGPAVGIDNFGSGHAVFEIANNRIRLNDTNGLQAIAVTSGAGGTFDGSVHDNRIESLSPNNDTGILLIGTQAAAPRLDIHSNQISGNLYTGISIWTGKATQVVIANNAIRGNNDNAVGTFGVSLVFSNVSGTFDASVFNNTFAGFANGLFANSNVGGRASGNIIAFTYSDGIKLQGATLTEDHTLFFQNGGPAPTLGTGSAIADPKFRRGLDDMRLSAGSPAIDAAASVDLRQLLTDNTLPEIDADGLRRFKGASSLADIGAFEFGDGGLIASATAANGGVIDNALLNGNASALPQLVQNRNPDTYLATATDPDSTGLAYTANRFGVIDEADGSGPLPGSAYNVFVPGAGDGAFLHTSASQTNVFGFTTLISNAYTDDHPKRILLATHRFSPLFDHPFGFSYFSGHWLIQQLDAVMDFPDGVTFHIYAQDPSLNAFTVSAPVALASLAIRHPLLDGEPCGRIHASADNVDPHRFGIRYASAKWYLYNLDGTNIPQAATFYIVIDEAATQFCRYDHVFHDGFEG